MLKNFKQAKAKGLIKGFLLGFLCIGLYFYPFVPREEILSSAVDKTPNYIIIFWESVRILMLICFEVGMFAYYLYLKQSCEQYQIRKDFDVQDEKETMSGYMYLGALTVVLSGWTVIIIQAIAQLLRLINT